MTPKKPEVDMSSEALWRRLEHLRALYKLSVYLLQAKPVEANPGEPVTSTAARDAT
jgi:hypothetical protein